jgi:tetratricopeptide (TPR) repeat protein
MASFDKALEIDPQNWTARFSRAMSNSQAPAFLGRQKTAIADFEKLIEQQKLAPQSKDHAHTYFFLSNLQEGAGHAERAAQVRAEARALFPDDPRFQ